MREINNESSVNTHISLGHIKGLPKLRVSLPKIKGNNCVEKGTEE